MSFQENKADEQLLDSAISIVEKAQQEGIVLRILGALAVAIHSKEFQALHRKLGRLGDTGKQFTDLDLGGYSKQKVKVANFLEKKLHYKFDEYFMLRIGGQKRHKFFEPSNKSVIDVFYDQLDFSHTISFGDKPGKGRLDFDYPTLPLTEIMLEKTQIHEITEKDVKDIIVMLRAHDLSESPEKEKIDARHIAQVLSNDWGFYYDVAENLKKALLLADQYCSQDKMSTDDLFIVKDRLGKLQKFIEDEPKTGKWKLRAKVGTSQPWYQVVEGYRTG